MRLKSQRLNLESCECKNCEGVLGFTLWYNQINLPNIWDKSKNNEGLFIELFTIIDTHERLHALLLESMSEQMEFIVKMLHNDPNKVVKRFKRK